MTDEGIDKLGRKIDAIEKNFDRRFERSFKYMSEQFSQVHEELTKKADKSDIETVINAIDGVYGNYDRLDTEQAATDSHIHRVEARVDRHNTRLKRLESST